MELEELKTIWQKYDRKLDHLEKLNKRIIPSTQFGFRKINMKIIQDTDEGVFCYLFTKAMKCFLPEKNFRKKGNEETLSKYMLISNLIYFTKISRNKNLKSDEEIVKNYIKYYNKHKPKIPFNKAYFNYWQGL